MRVQLMITIPDKLIMLMNLVILIPFFVRDVMKYQFLQNIRSFIPYLVCLAIVSLLSLLIHVIEVKNNYWGKLKPLLKCIYLIALYVINVFVVIAINSYLDKHHLIEFFGGDSAGSFMVFFIPSVIFYLILGVIVTLIFYLTDKKKG